MNNYKIKNITENTLLNSENQQEKQLELTIESIEKTDKIQFIGAGALKVTVSV